MTDWICHVCGYQGPGMDFFMIRPDDMPGGLLAQCAEALLCVTRQYGGDAEREKRFLEETRAL